jgi:hypothetical protein
MVTSMIEFILGMILFYFAVYWLSVALCWLVWLLAMAAGGLMLGINIAFRWLFRIPQRYI